MPYRDSVQDGERERGLAEIEEDRARQSLFTERGQDDGVSKVHGVDTARGDQKAALCWTGQMQQSSQLPGEEEYRHCHQTSGQWKLPSCGGEGHTIERHENRRRQTDGKHACRQPLCMGFVQEAGGPKNGPDNEDGNEGQKGSGHGWESNRVGEERPDVLYDIDRSSHPS